MTIFYYGESTHIDHIEGFTKESCQTAATFWMEKVTTTSGYRYGIAVCVPK